MKKIKLSQGFETLVDDEDYKYLKKMKWYVLIQPNGRKYAIANGWDFIKHKRFSIRMHRVITKATKGKDVDHLNSNGLDNRKCNLRLCSRSENLGRKRVFIKKTSKFRGISYDKNRDKWKARIRFNKKQVFIGRFSSENEAAEAYNYKSASLSKEYAILNEVIR